MMPHEAIYSVKIQLTTSRCVSEIIKHNECLNHGANRCTSALLRAHLFNSSRHMMSDTLIDWICQALETFLLHEGQEGLFKHGRCAEDDDGKPVILVWQAQIGRQHGVIPANLRRCKVVMKTSRRGISEGHFRRLPCSGEYACTWIYGKFLGIYHEEKIYLHVDL